MYQQCIFWQAEQAYSHDNENFSLHVKLEIVCVHTNLVLLINIAVTIVEEVDDDLQLSQCTGTVQQSLSRLCPCVQILYTAN